MSTREDGLDTSSGLARRVAAGAAWSSVGRLGSQGLQFAASLVLARLLLPSDFGLLASVMVFSGFAQLFFDLGMGAGLVQSRRPTEEDLSTVFWLNAIGGVAFAALVTVAGPLLAAFYGEPEIRVLAPIVALSFLVNVAVCHLALLQRALRFRAIALCELGCGAVGFATSIGLATAGLGAPSMALGTAVQSATMSVVVWTLVPWRPKRFIVRESLPRIWRFSGGILGFNIVNYWGRNADNLLVGRFSGAAALGYYNRAFNLMTLPVQTLGQVIGRVVFPVLSAVQKDLPRTRSAYLRCIAALNAATFPVLVGAAVASPALVPTLWGDRWLAVVPLLSILCIAGIPQSLGTSTGWLFQSQGRTRTMFKLGALSSAGGLLAMVIGARWGAMGVAWAVLVRSWVLTLPSYWVACRLVELRVRELLLPALKSLGLARAMGAIVWLIPSSLDLDRSTPATLALQVATGVLVYAAELALFQRSLISDVLRLRNQPT